MTAKGTYHRWSDEVLQRELLLATEDLERTQMIRTTNHVRLRRLKNRIKFLRSRVKAMSKAVELRRPLR